MALRLLACKQNLIVVCNTLHISMEFSEHYSQINSSDIPVGDIYEETNPAVIREGAPYEFPVATDAARGLDN